MINNDAFEVYMVHMQAESHWDLTKSRNSSERPTLNLLNPLKIPSWEQA